MAAEGFILDASPLILLAKIGALDLLGRLAPRTTMKQPGVPFLSLPDLEWSALWVLFNTSQSAGALCGGSSATRHSLCV